MASHPSRRPRVHQIMATLGYGDAIGNEALGIQRALRAAGYDSEIIVETADPRLEDLTVDYRDFHAEVQAEDVLVHHFSLGSRASRTAFALPARMVLIYHNITPPEYFLSVHDQLVRQWPVVTRPNSGESAPTSQPAVDAGGTSTANRATAPARNTPALPFRRGGPAPPTIAAPPLAGVSTAALMTSGSPRTPSA
jgi:hypothetical protein